MSAARITPTAVLLAPPDVAEDNWHLLRAGGIGGSDVPAILGMDRYRSPLHIWQAKRGEGRSSDSEAATWGRRLEGVIADAFAEESGLRVTPALGTLAHADEPRMRANIDRLVLEDAGPGAEPNIGALECKNRSEYRAAEWREEVPDEPALQAHWYLGVTGYSFAWVAALLGGNRLRFYRLQRDQELIDELVSYCMRWWDEHVATGVPPHPDGSKATTDLIARMWEAMPEAAVEVNAARTTHLLARRADLRARVTKLDAELAEVENELKMQLGEAEVALIGGRTAYTWIANGTFRAKAFRAEQPELAAAYVRQMPAIDTERLAADHPEIHRRYRARRLHVPPKGVIA
ncbi:YqaJ viral recombinase family protein [Actinomadura nitritigenes]|uniref:YqaJ viral recombinase family nuclease n=1 Tax=Actinomadura nitritigenes TaxID=134602 RepID=UPI003D8D8335